MSQERYERIKSNKFFIFVLTILKFCQKQWFFLGLGTFVSLAHSYPNVAKQNGHIKAQYSIGYGAVAVIFLISGLSMLTTDLMKNMRNWRAHLTVLSLSFLITSSTVFGFCCAIKASHNKKIDSWMLVGLLVTHCCPTTVSSNVVMTQQAHGNVALTLCEVFIGNSLGAFITPALVQMFTSNPSWKFGDPANSSSVGTLYGQVLKQLGLSVFLPLFVGQVIQNIFPTQTKWTVKTFKLGKVGSFMLLLIMWESFSTAFAQHAFTSVSHVSIVFLVLFNVLIYLFFTFVCFTYSRPWFIPKIFKEKPNDTHSKRYKVCYKIFAPFFYSRKDTVSVMLCGAAKTAALGVSLISSQYGTSNPNLGKLLVPLVLYQSEQVITAQILVNFMRNWIDAEEMSETDIENSASESKNNDSADICSQGSVADDNLPTTPADRNAEQ